ncbi:hypothetical protein BDV97DRAFT_95498 [Delphinella strobiligena]|nr:hypothetical protein BDV97DRAFT_95498 [Delphinella strobiligena]
MENNLMFYTVLLSLEYNVTSIAGRVNEAVQPASAHPHWPGPKYDAWNHRITLVHFSVDQASGTRRTFLVDTGFGATCPNQPTELRKDLPSTRVNVPPGQESCIHWTTIPDVVNKSQKMLLGRLLTARTQTAKWYSKFHHLYKLESLGGSLLAHPSTPSVLLSMHCCHG